MSPSVHSPDLMVVKQGRLAALDVHRDESASSSDCVIFGDFGITRVLPAYKTPPIESRRTGPARSRSRAG